MTTNATTTGTTCAVQCWMAREPDCRCSCGGRNHGILLTEDGERPRRNCTILGTRYVLGTLALSHVAHRWARALCDDLKRTHGRESRPGSGYYVGPFPNERGGVVWTKLPSVAQAAGWEEIAGWIAADFADQVVAYDAAAARLGAEARMLRKPIARRPLLVWVREDLIEEFDAIVEKGLPQ